MQFIIEDLMIQQVCHYIGLGEVSDYYDSAEYIQIKSFIEQAYARLYQATKVNWTEVYNPMVTDVINGLCYTYRAEVEGKSTVYDVLLDESRIGISEAVQHTECGEILAGDGLLRQADEKLKGCVDGLFRMADALDGCEDYDYIIIDTAPAMNSILHNCLIAADEVIIPVTADRYALQGLSQLFETIKAIRKRQNPKLNVAGLLLTKYNGRANLSREVRASLDEVAQQMGTRIFNTAIRECVKVKEAQARKQTLISYAPKCTAAEDYYGLADELTGRREN